MSARRCSRCGVSFPNQAKYKRCPGCAEETDSIQNASPDDDWKEQAWRVYYEIHDGARQGPSPDEVGAAEGRRLAQLERAYREEAA